MVGVGLLALHLFDQTYVFDEVNSKHRGTEDTEAFNSTRTISVLKNRKLVRSHGLASKQRAQTVHPKMLVLSILLMQFLEPASICFRLPVVSPHVYLDQLLDDFFVFRVIPKRDFKCRRCLFKSL